MNVYFAKVASNGMIKCGKELQIIRLQNLLIVDSQRAHLVMKIRKN